jgi:hypothetical protein
MVISLLASSWLLAGEQSPVRAVQERQSTATTEMQAERLGIDVVALRRTARGSMLDFRYRVVVPGKAAPLFRTEIKPYLIHQKTGARFIVPTPPKVGALRTTKGIPQAGRHYFIFFANPGGYVKAGDRVTIVIGEHRLENLLVQ